VLGRRSRWLVLLLNGTMLFGAVGSGCLADQLRDLSDQLDRTANDLDDNDGFFHEVGDFFNDVDDLFDGD